LQPDELLRCTQDTPSRYDPDLGIFLILMRNPRSGKVANTEQNTYTAEQLFGASLGDHNYKYSLKPTAVFFTGTNWTENDIRRIFNHAAEILSQCDIFISHLVVLVLEGPVELKNFSDQRGIEIVQLIPLRRPTINFVKRSLQEEAYQAEAIGKSNSKRRPELRYTIWVTEGIEYPSIGLTHTLAQILMDEKGHVNELGNVMQPTTSPNNVRFTNVQCEKITSVGGQNGLLRSPPINPLPRRIGVKFEISAPMSLNLIQRRYYSPALGAPLNRKSWLVHPWQACSSVSL